ncbi:MAG: PQQ-binding-like beta-propeller repeat protein [Planctomycetota bacterium]
MRGRLAIVAVLLLAGPAVADWPLARGDAESSGVAKSRLADQPKLLWRYTAPGSAFEATPVMAGGVVYVGDADGTLHAVRLADGGKVWSRAFEESGFIAAGAIRGDRLYVGDMYGDVFCVSAGTGELIWRFATDSEVYAGPSFYEGAVLVTTEGGTLFALDAASGKELWRFTIEAPLRCLPTVIKGHTLLAGCDAKLHAVDLSTGAEVGGIEIEGQTGCTPAAVGDRVYFGTEAGVFLAVDASDLAAMSIAWKYQDPRRGQGIRCAAGANGSLVVYGSNGKAIYGLDPVTGQPKWEKPVRSRVESSPLIVGDRVVAATTRGRLLLLNAADGETVWDYDAGGGFTSSPVVVDGKLLIANTDGTLYCFGSETARE